MTLQPKTWALFAVVLIFCVAALVLTTQWAQRHEISNWVDQLKDPAKRTAVAYIFGNTDEDVRDAVKVLVDALKDDDPYVRRYVAAALGEIDAEYDLVVPSLIEALIDADEHVRNQAAYALAKIGTPAVPSLVDALQKSYISVGQSHSPEDLQQAQQLWDEKDGLLVYGEDIEHYAKLRQVKRLSDYAAFALQEIGAGAMSQLVMLFQTDDPVLHRYAIAIIRSYGDAAVPQLIELLSDNSQQVRVLSAITLHQLATAESGRFKSYALKTIMEALKQPADQMPTEGLRKLASLFESRRDIVTTLERSEVDTVNQQYAELEELAADAMLNELAANHPHRARNAYHVLKLVGSDVEPSLVSALDDPSPTVRVAVAIVLSHGRLEDGIENKAMEILINEFQNPEQSVFSRHFLFIIIAEYVTRNELAKKTIIEAIRHPKGLDKKVVIRSIRYLVGGYVGRNDNEILYAAIDSNDKDVRDTILRDISQYYIGDPRVVAAVKMAIEDPATDQETREKLAAYLNPPEPDEREPYRRSLGGYISDDDEKEVRELAQDYEALLGSDIGHAKDIVDTLQGFDQIERMAAAQALTKAGAGAVPFLADALQDDKIRGDVVYILNDIGLPAKPTLPILKTLLDDQSVEPSIRYSILIAIGNIAPGEATEALRKFIVGWVRSGRPHYSSSLKPSESFYRTLGFLLNDKEPVVRREVSRILASSQEGTRRVLPALLDALHDQDEEVRLNAIRALRYRGLGIDDVQPVLTRLLSDSNAKVQEAALEALTYLGFDASVAGPEFWTLKNDAYVRSSVGHGVVMLLYSVRPGLEVYQPEYFDMQVEALAMAAGGPGYDVLPQFPLPVYPYSLWEVLPKQWLGDDNSTLLRVHDQLVAALNDAGYPSHRLFAAPEGFAVVAQIERIHRNGTPYKAVHRWTKGKVPLRSFNIGNYLTRLFREKSGHYRLIVFIVTTHEYIASKKETWAEEDARDFYITGGLILPQKIAKQPYKDRHLHVLIYHFHKRKGGPSRIVEQTIGGEEHLIKAGIVQPGELRQSG